MEHHITDKKVKQLPSPNRKMVIHYDDEIKGFGVRVTDKGTKSFILNYSIFGRERRLTIGQYPAWSVAAAREQARAYRQEVDRGIDPLAIKQDETNAKTVKELWKEYEKRHLPNLADRSQDDIQSMFDVYILPRLGSKRLKDMTGADIDDLHTHITTEGGSTRANRVLEILRSAINKGIRWGYCDKNPANGFRRNPEEPKDTYLTQKQLETVFEKLEEMPNQSAANVIRMLILTGARLGEVLNAEWSQFDEAKGLWVKPSSHTKQKRQHITPISPEVIELLKKIRKQTRSKTFLFPSEKGTPIYDIKKPWEWLQKKAKIPTVRVHDLRHTFASILVSGGESLSVIGKLLGHSQHQTTMRYAHLMDDPLRKAANKIGQAMKSGQGKQ